MLCRASSSACETPPGRPGPALIRSGYQGSAAPRVRAATFPRAYESYLRLLHRSRTATAGKDPGLLAALAALRRRAPGFLELYLLEARALRQAFYFSRDGVFLDRAFALLDAARQEAPVDPRVLFERFDRARTRAAAGGRGIRSGGADDLARRSRVRREGRPRVHQAARATRSPAPPRRSTRVPHLYNLALMEAQVEMDAARGTLAALPRAPPGSLQTLSLARARLAGAREKPRALPPLPALPRPPRPPTALRELLLAASARPRVYREAYGGAR